MDWSESSHQQAEHYCLHGCPRPTLVKSVRRHLRRYGIAPSRHSEEWQLAWRWACDIGASYHHFHWPSVSEIGAQYLLLVLAKMKNDQALRLPHRAAKQVPAAVITKLGSQVLPAHGFNNAVLSLFEQVDPVQEAQQIKSSAGPQAG